MKIKRRVIAVLAVLALAGGQAAYGYWVEQLSSECSVPVAHSATLYIRLPAPPAPEAPPEEIAGDGTGPEDQGAVESAPGPEGQSAGENAPGPEGQSIQESGVSEPDTGTPEAGGGDAESGNEPEGEAGEPDNTAESGA